jgi:signal transduction histidine kinase/CheY-like chemotaxis protein
MLAHAPIEAFFCMFIPTKRTFMLQRLRFTAAHSFLLPILFLFCFSAHAQLIFNSGEVPEKISLHPYAEILNLGNRDLSVKKLLAEQDKLGFQPVKTENNDLGFTTDHYWVRFQLVNRSGNELEYYLETARPITDFVELYTIAPNGQISKAISGDHVKCSDRSYGHRKTIFRVNLPPQTSQQFFLHMRSDGEVINLPLMLRTSENLMMLTSMEQFTFGLFYGILFIAAIIYFFFFFGLRERTFIYYAMYVLFIGLFQFAVDGYFFQYITPDGGWLSNHSVLLIATIAAFFLGRYSQLFLNLKTYDLGMNRLFDIIYLFLAILMAVLLFVPAALAVCYPITNILGMLVLILIITSIIRMRLKKLPVDLFYSTGIFFLVAGFVIFILNNFGQIPTSFFSQNSSKFGTGAEVIFLSLSMANLIKKLKNEKDEYNRLALQRSEEMNEMKSYFLSNISHELRTPLNAIISISTEMAKNTEEEKAKHDIQIIKYSSYNLLSSVNDILDFSKIEKGEIKLEPVQFEPVKVLEHIKNNAVIRAEDQGLAFEYSKSGEIPQLLLGDAVRLGQIVNNVLNNAIKFTAEGVIKFHVEGTILSKHKGRLTITISDTGVGIPKEKMGNIFGSFTQDNINNKRKFGGMGLGLYIVKNLVDMQKGSIKMESKVNEGTTCRIALDYEIIAIETPLEIVNENPVFDLHGKNILVVEDNAINQMVIKMITKKWLNTETVYANNGQEAIDVLKVHHFDIILMDLQMPVMDGYEATIAIRKGDAGTHNKNIPIIAVTADVMETTKTTVKEIGMNHYLSKPLKNETLYQAVKNLL